MTLIRALLIAVIAALLGGCGMLSRGERTAVLMPVDDERSVTVMDFSQPFPLSPPPPGWHHQTFTFRAPMELNFTRKDGVAALRVATDDSASMLFRYVYIPVEEFPLLTWQWLIEKPLSSEIDETTWRGDDSPARLFVNFETERGKSRSLEVIWGNRLLAGEVKYLWGFPHYVARGGEENAGRWHAEQIDLRALFERFWPDEKPRRIMALAIFCDSDNSGQASVSYFGNVLLKRR